MGSGRGTTTLTRWHRFGIGIITVNDIEGIPKHFSLVGVISGDNKANGIGIPRRRRGKRQLLC